VQVRLPDPMDGMISLHPSGTRLGSQTTEVAFLGTPEGANSGVLVANPPHVRRALNDHFDLEGIPLGLALTFSNGSLTTVKLFVASGAQSWSEWSEAEELKHRALLERALTNAYGNTRVFPWGRVDANYDPRSGSAFIVVQYANPASFGGGNLDSPGGLSPPSGSL
jgi:hypothetical protein